MRMFFFGKNMGFVVFVSVISVVTMRINCIFDYIHDYELKDECRVESSDFTRNSPLNFVNLILFFLSKTGLTNTMELTVFSERIGDLEVTKEAFFTN